MPDSITRREALGLMGAGLASMALPGCAKPEPEKRPNILWISCEDISPDLGCYDNHELETPNLDRLAAEGARYTKAFTVAPVCAPNRSGIITCMYPVSIGSMHMRTSDMGYEAVPSPYVKCFTEYLRAAGYFCTNRAKTDYQFAPPLTAWDRQGNDHGDWQDRAAGDQPCRGQVQGAGESQDRLRHPGSFDRLHHRTWREPPLAALRRGARVCSKHPAPRPGDPYRLPGEPGGLGEV